MGMCPCCGSAIEGRVIWFEPKARRVGTRAGSVILSDLQFAIAVQLVRAFPNPVPHASIESTSAGARYRVLNRLRHKLRPVGLDLKTTMDVGVALTIDPATAGAADPRHGLRPPPARMSADEEERLERHLRAGMSLSSLAAAVRRSRDEVAAWMDGRQEVRA